MKAIITKRVGKVSSYSGEASVLIDGAEFFTNESCSLFDVSIIDDAGLKVASLRNSKFVKKSWFASSLELWVSDFKEGLLIHPAWALKPLILERNGEVLSIPRAKKFKIGATTVDWIGSDVSIESDVSTINREFLLSLLVGYFLWSEASSMGW